MSARPGTAARRQALVAPPLEMDIMAAAGPPGMPRPTQGDHVTLYTLRQAREWLHTHQSTLSAWIKSGEIPARFVTRIGGTTTRAGKVLMSGDQVVGLLLYWRDQTAAAGPPGTPPPSARRRKRVAA